MIFLKLCHFLSKQPNLVIPGVDPYKGLKVLIFVTFENLTIFAQISINFTFFRNFYDFFLKSMTTFLKSMTPTFRFIDSMFSIYDFIDHIFSIIDSMISIHDFIDHTCSIYDDNFFDLMTTHRIYTFYDAR